MNRPVVYQQARYVLFGQQEGRRNGCRSEFPFRVLEVTTSSPAAAVAKTILRTSSCCAATATGSRAIGRKNTWWPG